MNLIIYFPLIAYGTMVTIISWIITSIASLFLGTLFGILACHHFANNTFAKVIKVYTFIAKGIPAYVQILIAYFALPALLKFNIPGFIAANIALAFCSSGYMTEIIRAGINSIPSGQWDAAFVLGYPLRATLKRIIMPQVFKVMLPALFGECEQLLKSTSLLATIGVTELTRTGMNIISRELNPLPVYVMIACIYLLFSAGLHSIAAYIEWKARHGSR